MKYAEKKAEKLKTMKNRLSLVSMFLVALVVASCNVERSEKYQALMAERDSLYTEAVAAKGGFDEALNTINEIESALEAVRSQENFIIRTNLEGNTNTAVDEINAIQMTLQENRNKINDLEKRLAEQGSKSKALTQTVSRLKKQLEEKDNSINALKVELQQSRVQIENLNNKLADLNENIDSLSGNIEVLNVQNAAQQATIVNQDAALNTVWICIGTTQVLKEKGILGKGGLFQSNKEISKQGFDKSQFMQADKRDLDFIPLNTKKASLITSHPEGSYQLIEKEDGNMVLNINDKDAFWSMSNYLVVSIK